MAINFFSHSRSKKKTPRNNPAGCLALSAEEDMDMISNRTTPRLLQRSNHCLLQEPEPYDEVRELGTGGNGKAILLERRSDRSLLVVKIINPFPGWSTTTIAKEAFFLKHRLPENDRIIRLTNYLQSAQVPRIQIYLEYCDGGDLAQLLTYYENHSRILPESFAWHAFRQIAEGLAFIHYGYDHKLGPNQRLPDTTWKKVIHADLKPENIFLRMSKITRNYPDLVLADFGNSHTDTDYHRAGTPYWLPPERRLVSVWGDTWTMGAIISSLAWRGTAPPRPSSPSQRTFRRGLDVRDTPILIRHQFGFPEPNHQPDIPGVDQCDYERDPVFVRPMLSYSHELNDLVAHTSHPHIHHRLRSWDCLQMIWYEMEVGAARSHPFVPLMSGWEPPLPARIPRHSSNDSSDDGEDPPDRGRTRKRKRVQDGDEKGHEGQDAADQSSTGERSYSEENSDKENHNRQDTTDRRSSRKRRRVEENSDGENHDRLGSPNRGPTGKRRHLEDGSEKENHNRQNNLDSRSSRKRRRVGEDTDGGNHDKLGAPNRGSTGKRRHFEKGGDEESHDRQDSPHHGSTGKRRHVDEGTDEENHGGRDSSDRGSTVKRKLVKKGNTEEHHDGQDRSQRGPTKRRRHFR